MTGKSHTDKSGSVFWRVAAVLIAVQIVTGVLAVGFTAWYARDQQLSLASVALTARMDAVSEEVERRAAGSDVSFSDFSDELRLDLTYRFPDPLLFLDIEGNVVEAFRPAQDAFDPAFIDTTIVPVVPDILDLENTFSTVIIDVSDDIIEGGFASAPLFDSGGFPVGILLVQPLTQSLEYELAETQQAFRSAIRLIALFSVLVALALGAFLTWWLVRPLRRMAADVSSIGEGSYHIRLPESGDDEFSSLSGAINAMTERVQLSIDSLRETDRVRRELVANVGHDLRTPLAAITAHLEEAERLRGEGRVREADQAIVSARRQGKVLGALVNDLFELSRLESSVPRLHLEPVLIPEIISDAISSNKRAALEQEVGLAVNLADNLPVLEADGSRVLRLLNNLISNAIRYAPAKSQVTISAFVQDGHLEICVEDRGEGIEPEALAQLFDRYYRGTHARTRSEPNEYDGTGLGLAISKAIAEAHGGTLAASSVRGEGTVFTTWLPLAH